MDKHTVNNHIRRNTVGNTDRELQYRIKKETIDKVLSSGCDNESKDKNMNNICDRCEIRCKNEHGGGVFVTNVSKMAYRNENYRESIWTGEELQATLMTIPRGEDIGVEFHSDIDQYIRVEHGYAMALIGTSAECLDKKYRLCQGDAIFIPAGTWHNIVNVGRCALKLSSIYAPPHHPRCTVERNKRT